MKGLLAGKVISSAFYPMLNDICVAFNVTGETMHDFVAGISEFMSGQHDPEDPTRVWWTYAGSEMERVWISINPGEYRTTPPELPCIVKDLPVSAPKVTSREMLGQALESIKLMPPFLPSEQRLVDTARWLLTREETHARDELKLASYRALESKDASTYGSAINALYDKFAQNMAWTASDFSLFILLVQIQASLNIRISENWSENPAQYLAALIRTLMQDKVSYPRALSLLNEIGLTEFESGREGVARALEGNMAEMSSVLILAWHRFFTATAIVKCLKEAGVAENDLAIPSNLPDEAAACTITGIMERARFAMQHPEAEALNFALAGASTFAQIRRETMKSASEIVPTYTRFFAEVLAAQALTLTSDQTIKSEGLKQLDRLRSAVKFGQDMEADWIDHAQMNAFRSLGDHTRAEALAFSLAGKMTVRAALSGLRL